MPEHFSNEQARALSTDAVYGPKDGVAQPERQWTVHEGTFYEANANAAWLVPRLSLVWTSRNEPSAKANSGGIDSDGAEYWLST